MKKTTIFTAVILVLFLLSSITNQNNNVLTGFHNSKRQNNDTTYIEWSKTRKLTWDDFRGVPDGYEISIGTAAGTFTSRYTNLIENYTDSLKIVISTRFIPMNSWVESANKSPRLLNHEQRHFDISEIFSRKFRNEILNFQYENTEKFSHHFKILASKYFNLSSSFGDNYDKETKHGTDLEAQKRWDIKIDSILNVLEAYSSPYVVVRKTYK